jgi:hypothetical protein
MKVQLFIPCFVDQLYPQTAFNMIKVLEKAGCTVTYNPSQTCCGQPAFNAGYWDDARSICSKFLRDFNAATPIVAPSASCVGFVRNYYTKLFDNSSLHNEVKAISQNIFEFSDFLVNRLGVTELGARLPGKATYHDSCAGLRECGIKTEPRRNLLRFRRHLCRKVRAHLGGHGRTESRECPGHRRRLSRLHRPFLPHAPPGLYRQQKAPHPHPALVVLKLFFQHGGTKTQRHQGLFRPATFPYRIF